MPGSCPGRWLASLNFWLGSCCHSLGELMFQVLFNSVELSLSYSKFHFCWVVGLVDGLFRIFGGRHLWPTQDLRSDKRMGSEQPGFLDHDSSCFLGLKKTPYQFSFSSDLFSLYRLSHMFMVSHFLPDSPLLF